MASCSIIQRIELCGSGHSCHWHHRCPQAGTSKTTGRRGDPHVGPPQGLPCTPSMAPAAPALGAGVPLSPSVSSQMDTHPEGTDGRREPIPDPGSTHSRHPWVMHGRIMVIIVRQDYSGTFRRAGDAQPHQAAASTPVRTWANGHRWGWTDGRKQGIPTDPGAQTHRCPGSRVPSPWQCQHPSPAPSTHPRGIWGCSRTPAPCVLRRRETARPLPVPSLLWQARARCVRLRLISRRGPKPLLSAFC